MLDLIEIANRDVLILMSMAFVMGMLAAIVIFYIPLRTKLDTIKREADRAARYQSITDRVAECNAEAAFREELRIRKASKDAEKVLERSRW